MIPLLANIGFIMALAGGLIFLLLGIAEALGIFWFILAPTFSLTAFLVSQ